MELNPTPPTEHIRQFFEEFERLCRRYDLVGACTVSDEQENGYFYHLEATWNAIIKDEHLVPWEGYEPIGIRIRIKSEEVGQERAEQLAIGTAWTFGSLCDFGIRTETWMRDFMKMLKRAGVPLTYKPFGGKRLLRLFKG